MIKIVNIKTGAIIAAYQPHEVTPFDKARYEGSNRELIYRAEKEHNNLMATLSRHNNLMRIEADCVVASLGPDYVAVSTGSYDIYGDLLHEH